MDKPMSSVLFNVMTFVFKIRDFLYPRMDVLKEAEIKTGFHILDYGCGPGSYSLIAAELVGPAGKVYALDIHPLAARRVQDRAARKGIDNIETIHSDCATGLESNTLDVALLTDIFHMLGEPDLVLKEISRVLKSEGVLAFNDHHMKEDEILAKVTSGGLFELSKKGEKMHIFSRKKDT